ncbi:MULTISPECIES: helix-turn-helix domain-containing protein [unclassified Yoonia]|uniref:helix-turn-helix domain-containing protein n=1 Tax=unclassified Yoonia TaxID=2629118 RepID=UPI002AFEF3FF|nr:MULTISPECIES: helix-turn-helix domain-containing protein [unclassified Yoonia]
MPIREIARRTGVSRSTIKKYLQGGVLSLRFRRRIVPASWALTPSILQHGRQLISANHPRSTGRRSGCMPICNASALQRTLTDKPSDEPAMFHGLPA